jgi:DNA-binding XRE family transcriptional regulator
LDSKLTLRLDKVKIMDANIFNLSKWQKKKLVLQWIEFRKDLGISQAGAAMRLKINRGSLNKIEKFHRMPSQEILVKISSFMFIKNMIS